MDVINFRIYHLFKQKFSVIWKILFYFYQNYMNGSDKFSKSSS